MDQGLASGCHAGEHKGKRKGKNEGWGLGLASCSGQDKDKGKGQQMDIKIHSTPLGQLLTAGCSPEEWKAAMERQQLAQTHLCSGHPDFAAYKHLLKPFPVQPDVNLFDLFDNNGGVQAAKLFLQSNYMATISWQGVYHAETYMYYMFHNWIQQEDVKRQIQWAIAQEQLQDAHVDNKYASWE